MRFAIVISDREYRKALIDRIAESGRDVVLDIVHKGDGIEPDALIITDAKPADIDTVTLNKVSKRIVFLATDDTEPAYTSKLHILFKYSSVSRLLADISEIYSNWKGIEGAYAINSKLIACCTDSDAFSDSRCTRIARQIVYRQGGRVLILPLGYINEHSADMKRDINHFARMMYQLRKGRMQNVDSMTYTDSYGISRLLIPEGRNPVAYLDEQELSSLILGLSKIYETLILDIGGCYRPENLNAIKRAGSVLCFQSGRRRINFEEILPGDLREKVRIIRIRDDEEDTLIDEYIDDLYGSNDADRDIESRYN